MLRSGGVKRLAAVRQQHSGCATAGAGAASSSSACSTPLVQPPVRLASSSSASSSRLARQKMARAVGQTKSLADKVAKASVAKMARAPGSSTGAGGNDSSRDMSTSIFHHNRNSGHDRTLIKGGWNQPSAAATAAFTRFEALDHSGATANMPPGAATMSTSLRDLVAKFPGARSADFSRFINENDGIEPHRFCVIKAGGAVLEGAELEQLAGAVAVLAGLDLRPIIVHGSGPQLNKLIEDAGIEPQFVRGIRVTDEATLEVANKVFAESNARLVDALEALGVRCRPFHGGVFEAELLDEATYGLVGKVTKVHDQRVEQAIRQGYVPVISSLGQTPTGRALNINADVAARDLALKVRPNNVIYLNATGGLFDDKGRTIPTINLAEDYDALVSQPWVKHGTRLKIDEIKAILDELPPSSSVSILKPADLIAELFSRQGAGTLVRTGERMLRFDDTASIRKSVDMAALRSLVESSFGGTLVPGYFEELFSDPPAGEQPRLAHLYVTESMRAAAIITREPGAPEGALYMDKLAVHNSFRGLGIAQLLWTQICKDIDTMFWRSRVKNTFNAWYYRQCDGSFQTQDWIVFFYGLEKLRDGEVCVAVANDIKQTIIRPDGDSQVSPTYGATPQLKRKVTPTPKMRARKKSPNEGSKMTFSNIAREYSTSARSSKPDMGPKRVAVVGARGYVGGELAALLAGHDQLELSAAFSRSEAGKPVNTKYFPDLVFTDSTAEAVIAAKAHVVVLALPNNASKPFVDAVLAHREKLKREGVDANDNENPWPVVVDVSADGRFLPEQYAYGLPEVKNNREAVKKAVLVANPGCYATSTQLALWPLVKSGLVAPGGGRQAPNVFAISGFSGAGSTPSKNNDAIYLADSILPYSPIGHVHEREVSAQMGLPIHFMPHVAPFFRGIQVTLNAQMTREASVDEVRAAFEEAYANEPLVQVVNEPVRARMSANTNGGIVGGFAVKGDRVVVNSAIDNLLKGAASQALQNINLVLGLDEYAGLNNPTPRLVGEERAPAQKADPNSFFVDTYTRPKDVVFVQGDGCWVTDETGKKWLDFTSGIAVNAFGHGDRTWAAVIAEQAPKLAHTSNLYHSRPATDLAEELVKQSNFATRVFMCNSGTEANEAALKFARLAKPGGSFVSCKGSFHGRSMGSLSVTYKPKIREPFGPLLDCSFLTFNSATDQEIKAAIHEGVAGVIVEPIQGEGGCTPATPEFLHKLRARCDEVGAALIYDEVQSGFGRTGYMNAWEGLGAPAPDIIAWAKPLGGGLPIGCTAVNERIASAVHPTNHGTTFGGNALVAKGALSTLKRLANPDFLRAVQSRGDRLRAVFTEAIGPENVVSIRGAGLLVGFELKPPLDAAKFNAACREEGLLMVGTDQPQVIRVLPPLNVTEDDLAHAAVKLRAAVKRCFA